MRWASKKPLCCVWMMGVVGCASQSHAPVPVAAVVTESPAQQRFKQAQVLAGKQSWQEAGALFAEARALDASMTAALFNEAVCKEHQGDLRGALDLYGSYHGVVSSDMEAVRALLRVQQSLGLYAEAVLLIEGLPAEVLSSDLVLQGTYAHVLRGAKQFSKALDVARGMLMADQKNVQAMKALALIYADKGDFQLASTYFNNALKLSPKDADIKVNLGLIAHKQGDVALAVSLFDEALQWDAQNSVAYANKAAISLAFRDYAKAREGYQKALSLGLVNCSTVGGLGYALEGLKESKQALEQFEKAYRMCAVDVDILFAMGNVCMQQLRDSACALKYYEAYTTQNTGLQKEHRVFRLIESLKSSQQQAPSEPVAPSQNQDASAAPAG